MQRRKKILWLTSWYPNIKDNFDGDFVQRQARAASAGHDIYVLFVTDLPGIRQTKSSVVTMDGLTEHIIYYTKRSGLSDKLKWFRLNLLAVKEYMRQYGKPDAIHVHIPWKAGLVALYLKIKYGLKYLVTEHWGIYSDTLEYNFKKFPFYMRSLIKAIYANAGSIVSVSKYLKNSIWQTLAIDKRSYVIPNVVDTSIFHIQEEKYPEFTFIHVSNMLPVKNVPIILNAYKTFLESQNESAFRLIMIGNRDNFFMDYANRIGLSTRNVLFTGEISYAEVAQFVRKSHAFVLISSSETFSCVTAESLCAGVPVIASDKGALPELVNSSNGMLVKSLEKEELAEAMQKMFLNYHLFDRMLFSKEASEMFGYSFISKQFENLYSSII